MLDFLSSNYTHDRRTNDTEKCKKESKNNLQYCRIEFNYDVFFFVLILRKRKYVCDENLCPLLVFSPDFLYQSRGRGFPEWGRELVAGTDSTASEVERKTLSLPPHLLVKAH